MSEWHTNDGLFKPTCPHGRERWPKCKCAWYLDAAGPTGRVRISLRRELGTNPGTKTEAESLAAPLREAIRVGTFTPVKTRRRQLSLPHDARVAVSTGELTVSALAQLFDERVITPANTARNTKVSNRAILKRLMAYDPGAHGPLGQWPAARVTEDLLEDFFRDLEVEHSTWNKYVTLVKKLWPWAARKGYLAASPLSGESVLLKRRAHAQRHRRVKAPLDEWLITAAMYGPLTAEGLPVHDPAAGDGWRLNAAAANRLAALIRAALETGCRKGELTTLRWWDVDLEQRTVFIRAVEEGGRKTGKPRKLPITDVLWPVLAYLRIDQAGDPFPGRAYVFGDERGGAIKNVRKAWETAVLHAHGYAPRWTATGALRPKSRAQLAAIDLHFHDLRHEAGHRWHEAGVPLNRIMALLGHATLTQTTTYLGLDPADLPNALKDYDAQRQQRPVAAIPWRQPRPNEGRNVRNTAEFDELDPGVEADRREEKREKGLLH